MHKGIMMKSMFGAVFAVASVMLVAGPAAAMSVPGIAGKTSLGADASCFNSNGGAAYNQCGRQVIYKIPLAVNAGFKTVTINTNNPGGGTFMCKLISTPPSNASGDVYPNVGIQTSTLQVNVPTNGTLYLFCHVNPNGQIIDVNYNQ